MEEQFSPDDQAALGWAFGSRSPSGEVLRERVQRGEQMTGDDVVAIRREWEAAGRLVHERHVLATSSSFPTGPRSIAVSFGDDPYARETAPAFGLYLDADGIHRWPHEHLAWPDFGLPDPDDSAPRSRGCSLAPRARRRGGIGCLGGHGRTGSALACLAVLTGVPADGAVDWVLRTTARTRSRPTSNARSSRVQSRARRRPRPPGSPSAS